MRPVRLVEKPARKQSGPWEVKAVKPKVGGGAMYGLGCIIGRFQGEKQKKICQEYSAKCEEMRRTIFSELQVRTEFSNFCFSKFLLTFEKHFFEISKIFVAKSQEI